ncbi:hypothetical protein HMN09_01364000 [Mycena chlorophos]|uniref:Uncharacterized protein n=1 Tax=Mycena chlorophos TaxID=658473 RepID=A0A8H6RYY7_MYCCL|nr:hypothetical protein HMN09_01364000 [Mycena chlorophos]
MTTPSSQPSLFDALTKLDNPNAFAVSEILEQLLQLVGYDICLTKRNHHTLYWAISEARDGVNSVNKNIKAVEDADAAVVPWDAWRAYTKKFPEVEEFLLKLLDLADKECDKERFGTAKTADLDVTFINTLGDQRKEIRTSLLTGTHDGPPTGDKLKALEDAQFHDDLSAFWATICKLRQHLATHSKPGAANTDSPNGVLADLDALYNEMATAQQPVAEASTFDKITCALLLEVVASQRDKRMTAKLRSPRFWKSFREWIAQAKKFVKNSTGSSPALEDAYKAACDYILKDLLFDLPDAYKKLLPMMAKIRRPYYHQSVALIEVFSELVQLFGNENTFTIVESLNTAIGKAEITLGAAANFTYDPKQPFQPVQEVVTALDEASGAVEACFKAFPDADPAAESSPAKKATKFKADLAAAKTKDSSILTRLNGRFTKTPREKQTSAKEEVSVSNQAQAGAATSSAYNMDSHHTLHSILWLEAAKADAASAAKMRKAVFIPTGGSTSKPIDFDTTIAKLDTGDGGKKTISLKIPG